MTSALGDPTAGRADRRGRPPRSHAVATAILVATAPGERDGPAALLAWEEDGTVLERLIGQLRSLGVAAFELVGRPAAAGRLAEVAGRHGDVELHVSTTPAEDLATVARIAAGGSGDLLVAQADVVVHREALAALIADRRLATGVLTTARGVAAPFGHRLRNRRGRVMSAGSPFHTVRAPNGTFLGLLRVAAGDRQRLAEVAGRLGPLRAEPPAGWRRQLEVAVPGSWRLELASAARGAAEDEAGLEAQAMASELTVEPSADPAAPDDGIPAAPLAKPDQIALSDTDAAELERRAAALREDVVALLVVGLVRDDVPVGYGRLRGFFWSRPLSPSGVAAARAQLAAADEDRIRLDAAVKPNDGFFTTFFVSPYSRHIARWCARHGISPNQVTVFSMALGTAAAAGFATGARWGLVAGAVLLQAAFTFDCVDGQLARYTRTFSAFGAWLDSILDRAKEYAVYAGLAVGASRHGVDPWVLAGAALALQTTRHAIDFTYPAAQRQAVRPLVRPPLEQPGDGLGSGLPGWLLDAPAPAPAPPAAGRPGAGVWARKVVTFPIGERFAVISLTAALTDARVTFVVLLCGGTLALAAGLASRIVRSVRTRATLAASDTEDPRLLAVCDHGLLVRALAPIGRAVPAPPWALLGAAAAILAVTIAATGATPPDGAVAAATAAVVVLGAAAAGRPQTDRLRWLAPPLLRAIELGGLAWLGAAGGAGTGPAAYALLCAVAFHHYDGIYRRSATVAGAGWDGRLVVAAALVIVGATPAGFWALAGVLCALFGGPAVRSWVVADRAGRTDPYDEQEDEQA